MYRRPVSPRRRRVRLSSTSSLVLLRSAPNNARQRKEPRRAECRAGGSRCRMSTGDRAGHKRTSQMEP